MHLLRDIRQQGHCQHGLLWSGCLKVEGIDLTMVVDVA